MVRHAGIHGERGARAYNGGLGAESPAGSRGRAPGQGVRGRSPPEAERFLIVGDPKQGQILHLFWLFYSQTVYIENVLKMETAGSNCGQ